MEPNVNYLDTLTEPQQLQVYELMAMGDIEDGNVAAKIYIECNYDLNRAIQRWLDQQSGMNGNVPSALNPINYSNPDIQAFERVQPQRPRNQRSELHVQYKRHLERKEREEEERSAGDTFKQAVGSIMSGLRAVWNAIMPIAIRGETPGGEQFLTYFRKNYPQLAKQIKFNAGTFESNVWHANATKLPFLVYLHIDGSVFREIPNNLFRSKNLLDFINNKFRLLGLLMNTEESQRLTKYIETKNCPCFGVFRGDLFDEIILVEYITFTNETTPEQVLERLRNLERNHYTITTEEDRIKHEVNRAIHMERMRNSPFFVQDNYHVQDDYENPQMFAFYGGGTQPRQPQRTERTAEEQQRLEEARILRQIQDEEYKEVERKILEQQQKQAEEEKLKREKEEQERIAQQLREEEERKKIQEKELQKAFKSQALPLEPEEGDPNAVLVIFRLPDGNRLERRFNSTDKAQSLYDFVDTKDVQFDSTTVRYDLMQPRPFLCLDEKEKTIAEYFEGSNHEVIHVRELTA